MIIDRGNTLFWLKVTEGAVVHQVWGDESHAFGWYSWQRLAACFESALKTVAKRAWFIPFGKMNGTTLEKQLILRAETSPIDDNVRLLKR